MASVAEQKTAKSGHLARTLGLWAIVGLGLGYMTPTVVFDTFGIVSGETNGVVPTSYFFALIVMMFTAISYGRMTRAFPSAGSAYTYTSETMSPKLGFLIGWAALLDYLLLPLVNALIIRSYMYSFFPDAPQWIWVVVYVAVITGLCLVSMTNTSRVNMVLVVFEVVLIGVFLILAGACDMLDGAVARVGGLGSRAGAVLDSSVDRFSDMAIYIGCLLHFALATPANITYQLLAVVALCNAFLISYVKARAENLIDDCSVGYWLRGERFAAVLIGCIVGHVPAVLWQMAISCFFTVWRRMEYTYHTLQAVDAGRPPPPRGPAPGWRGALQLWRRPRGSVAYDLVTGAHIAYIVFAPCIWPALLGTGASADPLRGWLAG